NLKWNEVMKQAEYGDIVSMSIQTKEFGRIAAQTAKQVIIQAIREAERGMIAESFSSKEHEILQATVLRVDPRSGNAIIEMITEGEKVEGILTIGEQVRNETLDDGDHIKVYVVEVKKATKGPQVIISRTHPGLVKRLFEIEVPEISDGIVEIKSIAREAGNRTKMAVYSNDTSIDPIGACVGNSGTRVAGVVDEINGEKIDIIKYSDDIAEYVSAALAPATIVACKSFEETKNCIAIVPDDQLSLAIGKGGQNARLAAKLTGCKIDIKPQSQVDLADF
ncbi:MAG: transcription termination factor NusA, partial [Clostridia bacterium]